MKNFVCSNFSKSKLLNQVSVVILLLVILFVSTGCPTTKEDDLISIGEANARIAAAYLFKDSQCGVPHQITVPVYANSKEEDINLCIMQLLSSDCATWNSAENIPIACLSISIQP